MFKKLLSSFLGLIFGGITMATCALAQPMGPPPGQFVSNPGGGGFQNQFREVRRTQMGPALGVNQQIVDQLLQIEARYKSRRQQLIQGSRADFMRLQQIMRQPSPSDREVGGLLSDIKQKKREMEDLQSRQGDEEAALLTPVQQARYILYLKSLLREARSVRRTAPGETMPANPANPRELPVTGNGPVRLR
jgi:hypothetical protein